MAKPDRIARAGLPQPLSAWSRRGLDWVEAQRAGVILATTIALASSFLADHYAAPAMLFALLIGMAFNFTNDAPQHR